MQDACYARSHQLAGAAETRNSLPISRNLCDAQAWPDIAAPSYHRSVTTLIGTTLLGLDVGDKRVGSALVLKGTSFPVPHACLDRAKGRAETAILQLINERGIKTVVVGLPLSRDGKKNEQCLRVERFCERLLRRADIEIAYVDEHLTSEEARADFAEEGSARVSRAAIDCRAACLILEGYLRSVRDGTMPGS